MALSKDRFFRNIVMVKMADGAVTEVERLGYESAGAIYDLDIFFGAFVDVRYNSRSILKAHPIHRQVAEHFGRRIDF